MPRGRARTLTTLGRRSRGVKAALAVVIAILVMPATALATGARPNVHWHGVSASGSTGMDLTDAWILTRGDPSVIVAYIEGGINWYTSSAQTLDPNIYVNWHELPVPCSGASVAAATMVVAGATQPCSLTYTDSAADYQTNNSGLINALDWSNDPRIKKPDGTYLDGNSFADPQDLIAAFSNNVNHDGGPYPNDISGWDFYDNQNDPATTDSAYGHANGQMEVIQSECPKCMILPIKAGEEALDATDKLAQAWLFAYQEGARVIVSVTADIGYSSFMAQVVTFLHSKGVVMVESSNDFDSPDHQGGMFWPYVIPGNGAVASSAGSAGTCTSVDTCWTRSDLTSWGDKNMFTAATGGGSTSESTPTLGGDFALLESYGNLAYSQGTIKAPLDGNEAIQVMRATATPFTDPTLPWPGGPGEWNPQYGYGMPQVFNAMKAVQAGTIPPAASFASPDWYTPIDPTTTSRVPVTGTVETPDGGQFTWKVEYGLGGDPSTWTTFGTGSGTGSFSGTFGTLDLSRIPKSLWSAAFSLSTTKEVETMDAYTVTFRVVVTDASGNVGEDRRAVSVVHDPTALPGFPLRIGPSVEGQPALVDLQGTGKLDLVFGSADGSVEALDPSTGKELPGWPAHTDRLSVVGLPSGIDAGNEPVISPVAVGDLFHTGQLDVVATSVDGRVYAFDAHAKLLHGWPQLLDTGVTPPAIPRPAVPYTRFPVTGDTAPPVLVPLSGGPQLQVVQAGMDGYLHAFGPDGSNVSGWPVKVSLPANFSIASGYQLIDDQTLPSAPAVAYLGQPGVPDLVERSQYTEFNPATSVGGVDLGSKAIVFAYMANGQPVPGWPSVLDGFGEYYGSAQGPITEGTDSPIAGPLSAPAGPQGAVDQVVVNPVFTSAYLLGGGGNVINSYAGDSSVINFVTTGAMGMFGGQLTYAQSGVNVSSLIAAEATAGNGVPILKVEQAFSAAGGGKSFLSGFPAGMQGMDFLGGPIFADVTGSGQASILEGGDSSAIQAYAPGGSQASGFPKFVSSWVVGAPSTGDLFSKGTTDLVAATREGWLYAWSVPGSDAGNGQWWRWRHDEWNSANYSVDPRPPGAARNVSWSKGSTTLTFIAPGGTWYSGTASHYDIALAPGGQVLDVAASSPAGSSQSVAIQAGTTGVSIQAVNASGDLGSAVTTGETPPAPPKPGYVVATSNGTVSAAGSAVAYGFPAASGLTLKWPIVSISPTPDGKGYWLLGGDGGVFTYGDASFYGSTGAMNLKAPVVGMAPTPYGHGYWLVAADGGVFTFGDAPFYGSTGGIHLAKAVVGMAPTPYGHGYWLVAADGGVFTFGDAGYDGSAVGTGGGTSGSFVSLTPTPDGGGYWLLNSGGDVFAYGNAVYWGSAAQTGTLAGGAAAALVPMPDGNGYWITTRAGNTYTYGDAPYLGQVTVSSGDAVVGAAP